MIMASTMDIEYILNKTCWFILRNKECLFLSNPSPQFQCFLPFHTAAHKNDNCEADGYKQMSLCIWKVNNPEKALPYSGLFRVFL